MAGQRSLDFAHTFLFCFSESKIKLEYCSCVFFFSSVFSNNPQSLSSLLYMRTHHSKWLLLLFDINCVNCVIKHENQTKSIKIENVLLVSFVSFDRNEIAVCFLCKIYFSFSRVQYLWCDFCFDFSNLSHRPIWVAHGKQRNDSVWRWVYTV